MPFKSYSQMRAMFAKDPKMAQGFVAEAKKRGLPVVSKDNPGYSSAAKRRMQTIQKSRKEQEKMSANNKDRLIERKASDSYK